MQQFGIADHEDDLPISQPRSLGHAVLAIGIFLLTFTGTCFGFHFLLPALPTTDPILLRKLDHFAAHKDDYDVLFFGSSQIYRDFVPKIFDREMATHGRNTHSFNFGIGGMRPHETNQLIRQILDMNPQNLKYAFVELGTWDPTMPERNQFTTRVVAWHTPEETPSILRTLWRADMSLRSRWDHLYDHARHSLANYFRIGEGQRYLRFWTGARDSIRYDRDTPHAIEEEGFVGHEEAPAGRGQLASRSAFLKDPRQYERLVKVLVRDRFEEANLDHYNFQAVADQVQRFREHHVEPIYVVPPHVATFPEKRALLRQKIAPAIFAFNDPAQYPSLYDVQRRFDLEHLLAEGAEIFTRLLAEQFARYLDDQTKNHEPRHSLP
ncbi:MAG: hypothetical protein U1D30_07965 [Planctomycetota bacterium]